MPVRQSGSKILLLEDKKRTGLSPSHVFPLPRVDLDQFALFDEERNLQGQTGFQFGGFHDIVCRIPPDSFRGFDHLEGHAGGGFDRNGLALDEKDFASHDF